MNNSQSGFQDDRFSVRDIYNGRSYDFDVVLTSKLFDPDNLTLKHCLREARASSEHVVRAILCQTAYHYLYDSLAGYLDHHRIRSTVLALEKSARSECSKSIENLCRLAEELHKQGTRPGDTLLLVGGGVLMDLAGFHASVWRRGGLLKYVAVPTTLTAAIDAAISSKTAINVGTMKNYYGTHYPPSSVLVDAALLRTLGRQSLLDGVAEMAKVAVIGDEGLFRDLESDGAAMIRDAFQSSPGNSALWRSVRLFLDLRHDIRYKNRKTSIRSFGHGFSRELESAGRFRLTHGQAVSIEMRTATRLATICGVLSVADRDRIQRCFDCLDLPRWCDVVDCDDIWSRVFSQRLVNRESLEYPVPQAIGQGTYLDSFGRDELRQAMRECREHANGHTIRVVAE